MFTGELVDNRSRRQVRADERRSEPQQQSMFKLSEILATDVKANPVIDTTNLASAKLVLISEDVRSDEEKEAALRHAAEELTQPMFADENVEMAEEAHDMQPEQPIDIGSTQDKSPTSPKERAYLEVVRVVCERITTLWIEENYQQKFHLQLADTILAAQDVGLTLDEISIAIQIGKHMGEQQHTAMLMQPSLKNSEMTVSPSEPEGHPSTKIVEGYRVRMRRKNVKLRGRNSNAV